MSAVPEQNHTRKPASSRAAPGPRSRPNRLARADRRTQLGRVIREAERELRAELGEVTFAQGVIVEAAAVKRGRLWLLRKQMEAGEQTSEETVAAILSLTNSLRADLVSLGLAKKRHLPREDSEPVDHDPEADLAAHLRGREAPRG